MSVRISLPEMHISSVTHGQSDMRYLRCPNDHGKERSYGWLWMTMDDYGWPQEAELGTIPSLVWVSYQWWFHYYNHESSFLLSTATESGFNHLYSSSSKPTRHHWAAQALNMRLAWTHKLKNCKKPRSKRSSRWSSDRAENHLAPQRNMAKKNISWVTNEVNSNYLLNNCLYLLSTNVDLYLLSRGK